MSKVVINTPKRRVMAAASGNRVTAKVSVGRAVDVSIGAVAINGGTRVITIPDGGEVPPNTAPGTVIVRYDSE